MPKWLLFSATAFLLTAPASPAPGPDDSRAIIEKAIKAHGGEEKLAKLHAVRIKSKGTVEINARVAKFTREASIQLPVQSKRSIQVDLDGKKNALVYVHNGDKDWKTFNGQMEEFTDSQLANERAGMHEVNVRSLLPLVKNKAYSFFRLEEIKVNDRPAGGVRVTAKGQKDINLYFDKGNGLLVKIERRLLDHRDKEMTLETTYSEYKEIDGLKQPMKSLTLWNGKKYIEEEVTEMKFVDRIDDKEFGNP